MRIAEFNGRKARSNNELLSSNPYPKGGDEWSAWRFGWMDRNDELEAQHDVGRIYS